MIGFRGSLFTSPTGLYAQFIPASFSSSADASVTRSATSGEPVAASAIAPGLLSTRRPHQRNQEGTETSLASHGQLGASFIATKSGYKTWQHRSSVSFAIEPRSYLLKADRFPDRPQSSADVRARHSWLSAAASARVRALALHLSIRIVPAAQNIFAGNTRGKHTLNVAPRENDVSATHSK